MKIIPVRVAIEPSGSGGQAVWVRSEDKVWWKWYGSRLDACVEAAQLGLANRQEYQSEERCLFSVRYSAKEDAMADPDELVRFGFGPPSFIEQPTA